MPERQTVSAAVTADIAEQALREIVAKHGLTGTLEDAIQTALAAAYEWGADAGYRLGLEQGYDFALVQNHIPADD
jgi:hypothetical protein